MGKGNAKTDQDGECYYQDCIGTDGKLKRCVMETEYREQFIKFGLKVQYYRKLRGMTQEAFADEIGKSWSFVAKIESPTRPFGVSMETMFKIAEVLNIPVSKLFED